MYVCSCQTYEGFKEFLECVAYVSSFISMNEKVNVNLTQEKNKSRFNLLKKIAQQILVSKNNFQKILKTLRENNVKWNFLLLFEI